MRFSKANKIATEWRISMNGIKGLGVINAIGSLFVIAAFSSPVNALDGYRDRKGFFAGIGTGGGVAFQGSEPGAAIVADFQLGGGVTENLTLALDTDLWFQLMYIGRNTLLTPGPEVNYFFGDTGLFIRGGIGMAMTFIDPGADGGEKDFKIGFDGGLGVGWEFFVGSDLALGLAIEGDYVVLLDFNDIVNIGFVLSLKYY